MRTVILLTCLTFAAPIRAEEAEDAIPSQPEAPDPGDVPLTPEIIEKLPPGELAELLKAKEDAKTGGKVAWIASLASFVFAAVVVGGALATYVRVHRVKQETLRLALEKGFTPEQLFPARPPTDDLRRGILLCATGVGLALVTGIIAADKSWASLGLLPISLGVGFLTTWRVSRPKLDLLQAAPPREV